MPKPIKKFAFVNSVGVNNELIADVPVDRKLPPKYLKKSALINGINEYQKAPPNKMLRLNAKIYIMHEIEIAAVYERKIVEIDRAITV